MFRTNTVVRLTLLAFAASLLISAGACNRKEKKEIDNKNMDHKLPASEKLGFKNSDKQCKLDEVVQDPEKGTAEYALLTLFKVWKKAQDASWAGEDDDVFQQWRELFNRGLQENKTGQHKRSLGDTLAKAKLEHFVSDKEFAIIICKKQNTGSDDSSYRFYVRNDKPKSSNKPITVLRDENGEWKINDGSVLLY